MSSAGGRSCIILNNNLQKTFQEGEKKNKKSRGGLFKRQFSLLFQPTQLVWLGLALRDETLYFVAWKWRRRLKGTALSLFLQDDKSNQTGQMGDLRRIVCISSKQGCSLMGGGYRISSRPRTYTQNTHIHIGKHTSKYTSRCTVNMLNRVYAIHTRKQKSLFKVYKHHPAMLLVKAMYLEE